MRLKFGNGYCVPKLALAALAMLTAVIVAAVPSGSSPVPAQKAPTLAKTLSAEASAWVDKTLAALTLEKKIGQIVCSDVTGGYIAADDPRLVAWLALARDQGLGMFVLYGGTPI